MSSVELPQAIRENAMVATLRVDNQSLELVRIPPGNFLMGSPSDEEGRQENEARRAVEITRPFYLGRTPVTQAFYESVMKANPSRAPGPKNPVDQIDYVEGMALCLKLTLATGVEVTLPTEAQWEYACRAGTTTRFSSGQTVKDLAQVAWFRDNAGEQSHAVALKDPNAWGLFDMHGNIWELCLDYLPAYRVRTKDPVGIIDGKRGALRGGGWMDDAADCRSACRMPSSPRFGGIGVRIAVNPQVDL